MRGKLVNRKDDWYIMRIEEGEWETYYPLHPDDIKLINEWRKTFDTIDARLHNQDVEFEIIKEIVETGVSENPHHIIQYAKPIIKKPTSD
jgi:hypothetical protein